MQSLSLRTVMSLGAGLLTLLVIGGMAVIISSAADLSAVYERRDVIAASQAQGREVSEALVVQRALQAEFAITADLGLLEAFEATAETAFATLDELALANAGNAQIGDLAERVETLDVAHDALIVDELVPLVLAGDRVAAEATTVTGPGRPGRPAGHRGADDAGARRRPR